MKRSYFAAAALLLGTSALAWTPTAKPMAAAAAGAKEPVTIVWDTKPEATTAALDESAPVDSAFNAEPKLVPASAVTWDEEPEAVQASATDWDTAEPGEADLDLAETSIEATQDETDLAMAADDVDPAMGETLATPEAPVTVADASMTTSDLTPRPAAGNYPACDPGPGDDNCIQLYEPGVRTALASWTQPTGGLIDGSGAVQTAMGGPDIEAGEGDPATAMNGDGTLDMALGESDEVEPTLA